MRYNFSLILAVAATLRWSSNAASPSTPLASLAAASKRAFINNNKSTTTNNDDNTDIPSVVAQDITDLVPSGGADGVVGIADDETSIAENPALDEVADAPLISDIEMLSNMLAEVIKKENPTVFNYYTQLRTLGKQRASNPNDVTSFEEMKKIAHDVSPEDTLGVMKTFAIALNLVNAAEVHHRMRIVRNNEEQVAGMENVHVGPLPMVEDSIRGTLEIMLENDGINSDEIFNKLITQKCEIVLTAHPTEVNRKTIIRKCKCFNDVCCFYK